MENVSIKTEFSSPQQGNFVLNITGSGTIKTYFAKVIGHSEMSFGSKSEVLWGIKKLNLALALDNTGSMNSSGKMTALKTAAHNLLDTLKKAEKTTGRHQGVDRPVRGRRQCRHQQCRRDLDRLGRLGRRQRRLQQVGV